MKRHIHPIHKAGQARQKVQKKVSVVMAHRALFPGHGGAAHVPGCSSTDRACEWRFAISAWVSALRCEEDPDDPIDDSEADPGVPRMGILMAMPT